MYSSIFITISIIFDNILEAQVGGHVAVVSFNLLTTWRPVLLAHLAPLAPWRSEVNEHRFAILKVAVKVLPVKQHLLGTERAALEQRAREQGDRAPTHRAVRVPAKVATWGR